jgi:hypothetical protein
MAWVARPRARGDGRGVYRGFQSRRSVIPDGTTPFQARKTRLIRDVPPSFHSALVGVETRQNPLTNAGRRGEVRRTFFLRLPLRPSGLAEFARPREALSAT